jgi:hypothetical protein
MGRVPSLTTEDTEGHRGGQDIVSIRPEEYGLAS